MLLKSARFLILPALCLESARRPLKLLGRIRLFNPMLSFWVSSFDSADIRLEPAYSIFSGVNRICDPSCECNWLTIMRLHYPPRKPYIVFFEVQVANSLLVAEVSQGKVFFSNESVFLWEREIGLIVKRFDWLVKFIWRISNLKDTTSKQLTIVLHCLGHCHVSVW